MCEVHAYTHDIIPLWTVQLPSIIVPYGPPLVAANDLVHVVLLNSTVVPSQLVIMNLHSKDGSFSNFVNLQNNVRLIDAPQNIVYDINATSCPLITARNLANGSALWTSFAPCNVTLEIDSPSEVVIGNVIASNNQVWRAVVLLWGGCLWTWNVSATPAKPTVCSQTIANCCKALRRYLCEFPQEYSRIPFCLRKLA